jgi:hypothetical protein
MLRALLRKEPKKLLVTFENASSVDGSIVLFSQAETRLQGNVRIAFFLNCHCVS